jgi:hypothetical protein
VPNWYVITADLNQKGRALTWCDKLASTPAVGFKLNYHFASGDSILLALAPLLDKWIEDDKPTFAMNTHESFGVNFGTNDGFVYGIEPGRTFIEFRHRVKWTPTSGGPPVARLTSTALPFSELLPQVSGRLVDATSLILKNHQRQILRVGIISTTTVSDDDMPPGIARFIRYVGRPWKDGLDFYTLQVTATIDTTPDWTDRCVHIFAKLEDPEQLPALKFDWQRTFTAGRSATPDSMKEILGRAEKSAMQYFEDLAEGNRFDEDLIRATTRT